MGILDRRNKLSRNTALRITQEGREKLFDSIHSDERYVVLMHLEGGGTMNLAELSQRTGISVGRLEHLIPRLIPDYITPVGAGISGNVDVR